MTTGGAGKGKGKLSYVKVTPAREKLTALTIKMGPLPQKSVRETVREEKVLEIAAAASETRQGRVGKQTTKIWFPC